MSDVDIFHAPRDFEFHDFDTRNVTASDGGTATLRFPRLDADAVHALAASVRRHRAEKLARYSTDGIVDVIARAVELWTDPEYPERRLARASSSPAPPTGPSRNTIATTVCSNWPTRR